MGGPAVFLVTTTATSLTGFGFPFVRLLPSDIVGAISLVVLAVAIVARYRHRMARGWRATYVITAVMALYFNVFVLVVQSFQKLPALAALAPTQSEPPCDRRTDRARGFSRALVPRRDQVSREECRCGSTVPVSRSARCFRTIA